MVYAILIKGHIEHKASQNLALTQTSILINTGYLSEFQIWQGHI